MKPIAASCTGISPVALSESECGPVPGAVLRSRARAAIGSEQLIEARSLIGPREKIAGDRELLRTAAELMLEA